MNLRRTLLEYTRLRPEKGGEETLEAYVLRLGHRFESVPLSGLEPLACSLALHQTGPFKQHRCFRNALRLVLEGGVSELCYVEGYFTDETTLRLPIHHAWASLNGKVVDPTPLVLPGLPSSDARLGLIPEGWTYYGVEIPTEFIQSHVESARNYGSVLADSRNRIPPRDRRL